MRTGKFFTAVTMLCLCFFIMQPVQASVKETGTELTTQVPDEHLVSLDIGEHGAVTADGKKYTGKQEIKVGRLKEQLYQIKPDSGYQADKVQYGGKTVQLTGSSYTAEAIHQDGLTLKVTFKKEKAAASGSGKKQLIREYSRKNRGHCRTRRMDFGLAAVRGRIFDPYRERSRETERIEYKMMECRL
ncbi:hypothetical protein PMF13cell1_01916 [Blautia producta]|uniref:Uncharacterized protein n=1 Tax=Blautia producta TaxID=33035 RepID=A0A4P6LWX1_9FIRM|nr:hypothetical protein [Blautia producta]QBE96372.1 hypothetical protein PMF13cell1_01916 [Blautia producta]